MPPKGRSSRSATKSHQSTLAFHGSSNRVIKAGVKAQTAKKNNLEKKLKDVKPEVYDVSAEERTTTEAALMEQTGQEIQAQQVESSAEEERARGVSDAAIKKYWAAKEKQRLAPRIHQEGLSIEDKILREFDMSAHYGPCSGVARVKRWKRAQRLGLEPAVEVLAVLLKAQEASERDKMGVQRSIVDEMLNAKAELDM